MTDFSTYPIAWKNYDKGGAVFNVLAYDAIADGVTNDSAAFTAAIAAASAAGGGRVWCPGTFAITSEVALASNVILDGPRYGASIVATVPTGSAFKGDTLSNVHVMNLRISGSFQRGVYLNGCTYSSVETCQISGATTAGSPAAGGIILYSCTDCDVVGNRMSGNGVAANNSNALADILLDTCTDCNVRDNRCASVLAAFGIAVQNASYLNITGNDCANSVTSLNNNLWGYGIMLYGYSGGACEYNVVSGNRVSVTGGSGIYLQTARFNEVTNNILYDTVKTQTLAVLAAGGIAANSLSTDNTIAFNTIHTCGKAGIEVDGARNKLVSNTITAASLQGIRFAFAPHNSEFSGNTITSCAGGIGGSTGTNTKGLLVRGNTVKTTTGANHGLAFDSMTGLVLEGNEVREARASGIVVSNSSQVRISGNVAVDNNQQGTTAYGIQLSTVTGSVTGNLCYNEAGATQTTGIIATGTCLLTIADNEVVDAASAGITLTSSDCTVASNNVRGSGGAGVSVSGSRNKVHGNTIATATLQGILFATAPHDCDFSGNTITGCAGGIGGPSTLSIKGLVIRGNVVKGTTGTNGGIEVDSVTGLVCEGNEIREAETNGITVSNASRCSIVGNTCVDNDQAAGSYDGIRLSAVTLSDVSGNQCYNEAGTTQTYGVRATSCAGVNIHDNVLYNNVTGPILVGTSTGMMQRSNRFASDGVIQGTAALVGGTVTVSTTEVAAGDTVLVTRTTTGGTPGHLSVGTITAATSFVVNSSDVGDTSTIAWEVVH